MPNLYLGLVMLTVFLYVFRVARGNETPIILIILICLASPVVLPIQAMGWLGTRWHKKVGHG